MKKSFAGKSGMLIFVGAVALVSAAAIILNSCNKKADEISETDSKKIRPKKEIQKTAEENNSGLPEITENNKRIIYLTFDDGPNNGTKNLLKIVHQRKIPVTAFIVAKHVYGSSFQKDEFEILKNDSLIEVANHSFSHAENKYSRFYENPEKVVADFNRAKDSLQLENNYARTPGRNIWRTVNIHSTDIKKSSKAADELQKSGYKLIGWDLEWKPDNTMKLKGNHKEMLRKVDSIFFNDLEKTSRHLVFLTHDQYLNDESSVNELSLFIEGLQKSNRFEFRKISEYPKINDILN